MPALPSWLTNRLRDQFTALLPGRPAGYHPDHPLGRHRRPVADRVVFDTLIQALVAGCGYRQIAEATLHDGPTSRPAVERRTVRAELEAGS